MSAGVTLPSQGNTNGLNQTPVPAPQYIPNAGSAPPGYTWDAIQGKYVPTVLSAPNAASQQTLFDRALTSSLSGATKIPPSIAGLASAAGGTVGFSGSTGSGGSGGGGALSPSLAPVNTSAAEAASFAKAKDQVGLETSGALTGLRSALAGRGLLGSGSEGLETAQVANEGQGQLGDVTRQQAVTRADLAQKNAETNFTGGITERGQDIQKEEAANSLAGDLAKTTYQGAITQRQQDIQYQTSQEALQIEQAQLAAQQRATALTGLESALKVTAPNGLSY